MKTSVFPALLLGSLLFAAGAMARDLVTLESRYLGDGVFEYTVLLPEDRYFEKCQVQSLGLASFAEITEFLTTPDNWGVVAYTSSVEWRHDSAIVEELPYRVTFRMRSGLSSYRRARATAIVEFQWYPWVQSSDVWGVNIVGYANLTCLAPCSPEEADGTDPVYVDHVAGYPELEVESIVFSNSRPVGLRFSAGSMLPVEIEASEDLRSWKTIGATTGTTGVTTWISPTPLDTYGRFYRVVVRRST